MKGYFDMIKKIISLLLILLFLLSLCSCSTISNTKTDSDVKTATPDSSYTDAITIKLDGSSASVNGEKVSEYDYTWHTDPTTVHTEVKDSPSEYYTGSLPDKLGDIYIDHELYYYPKIESSKFKLVNYDGEQEWAYYYEDGENNDFIYSTLPHIGNDIPTDMMHSEEDALKNKVLHISKEGTYILSGSWDGQIKIDLGDKDDVFSDETKKVNLILDGANIKCTVAPSIVFEDLYESDNSWEESETHTYKTKLENTGANIIIADGSENVLEGNNIYRMLKSKYKDEDSKDEIKTQKKSRKLDGALYSYVSMNVSSGNEGTGKLNIKSNFEGLDSELHLAINSGNITIDSQDDGINVNEDNVSTFLLNDGVVTINNAQNHEGDGIDSNGYVVLNGGELYVNGVTAPDNAVDSEDGIMCNGTQVYIDGEKIELNTNEERHEISSSTQGMQGGGPQGGMPRPNGEEGMIPPDGKTPPQNEDNIGENFDIKKFKEEVSKLSDDATFDDVLDILGMRKPDEKTQN